MNEVTEFITSNNLPVTIITNDDSINNQTLIYQSLMNNLGIRLEQSEDESESDDQTD